jgi:hypothetical protein
MLDTSELLKKLLLLKQLRNIKHTITEIHLDSQTYRNLCNEKHDMFLDRFLNVKIKEIQSNNLLIEIM